MREGGDPAKQTHRVADKSNSTLLKMNTFKQLDLRLRGDDA